MSLIGAADSWSATAPTNPVWEPITRLAIRKAAAIGAGSQPDTETLAEIASALIDQAQGDEAVLRQALAVFVNGADRGEIGSNAADAIRSAIRSCNSTKAKSSRRLIFGN